MTLHTSPDTASKRYATDRMASKAYRDRLVTATVSQVIGEQIHAMRAMRGWTQAELGHISGMKQSAISRLENLDVERPSITTLERLASAFDVALIVKFAPFSELLRWKTQLSEQDFDVPSFENDTALYRTEVFSQASSAQGTMPEQKTFPRAFWKQSDGLLLFPDPISQTAIAGIHDDEAVTGGRIYAGTRR